MNEQQKKLIAYFEEQGGIVRFSSILEKGFHPDTIEALKQEEHIQKIAHGLYCLKEHDFGEYADFIFASYQAPRGVICLVSALSFHAVTQEVPRQVDMAIPVRSHVNKIVYPPTRIYTFNQKTWESGVEEHVLSGQKVKIYSLAKTIADCFKFRNRIGVDVAREALANTLKKGINPIEIIKYAKMCRVQKIVQPLVEMMI